MGIAYLQQSYEQAASRVSFALEGEQETASRFLLSVCGKEVVSPSFFEIDDTVLRSSSRRESRYLRRAKMARKVRGFSLGLLGLSFATVALLPVEFRGNEAYLMGVDGFVSFVGSYAACSFYGRRAVRAGALSTFVWDDSNPVGVLSEFRAGVAGFYLRSEDVQLRATLRGLHSRLAFLEWAGWVANERKLADISVGPLVDQFHADLCESVSRLVGDMGGFCDFVVHGQSFLEQGSRP